MKRIIVLFVLLLGSIISIAQPVTQRGTTSVTVQDARLFAQYNFRPPVFPDTTSANTQIGLDSCGALIYSRDINAYYYRACSPKRWVRVSPGGSVSDSAYFSYRPLTDSTFLLCRVGGTRCDTIKVNGKGVSTAWLIGGNVNPIPPYIGTIDTKELDIITNNVVRMRVAGNGINRSSAARNKFLTMDTTTRYLYYTDGGGGIDTIPSLQDVLTAGNTSIGKEMYVLDTINNKGFNFYTQGNPNSINYGPELYIDAKGFNNYGIGLQSGLGDAFSYGKIKFYNGDDGDKTLQFPNSSTGSTIIDLPSYSVNTTGEDTLATLADIRNSAIDTSNKFVNNIYRTSGVDSIYYTIGSTTYAIKDSVGSGGSGGIPHGTATGTDTYAVTISGVTSYADGDAYLVRFTNGNTTGATLNINGLGARALYRNNDGVLIGGDIVDGGEMLCTYNSTTNAFQCIGTAPNTLLAYVTNADASTITKGQVVYAFGGTGDRMTVKLANNSSDATSAQTVGVVLSTSIATNQKGFIIVQGLLDGLSVLPTSTYADGDPLFLGSTAGSITNIKPSAPQHLVYLGNITTASNGAAGRWYVRIQNGYELQELHNVAISSPANNQVLAFSDTQSLWKNRNIYTIVDTNNIIATKYRADTSRTNIYNALNGKQNTLTFSTGLTNSSGTVTSNLSTGVAGGQSVVGGTAASNSLTLSSTSNATKGKILFGTSAYDETTNNLSIGTTTDAGTKLNVNGAIRWGTSSVLQSVGYSTNRGIALQIGGTSTYKLTNAGSALTPVVNIAPNGETSGAISLNYDFNNGYGLNFAAGNGTNIVSRAAINIATPSNTVGAESGDLTFLTQTGGTAMAEKMRIFGGGNVAIGQTTDAGFKLDVNGTTRINSILYTTNKVSLNSQNGYVYRTTDASSGLSTFTAGIYQVGTSTAAGNQAAYFDFSNTALTFAVGNNNSRLISRTGIGIANLNNTAGSESGDLIFLTQSGGTAMSEKMRITGVGGLTINATNTASGTTGNQTINKASGTVNIAAAGTTVTVTNSLVTTSSIVFAVIRTNDATATIKNVVPAAGSFTINLGSATTAETSIGFFVIN